MTTTISFNWWNSADKSAEIPEEHDYVLKVEAIRHIANMAEDGYLSGELHYNFHVNGKDVNYRGYWEFK